MFGSSPVVVNRRRMNSGAYFRNLIVRKFTATSSANMKAKKEATNTPCEAKRKEGSRIYMLRLRRALRESTPPT